MKRFKPLPVLLIGLFILSVSWFFFLGAAEPRPRATPRHTLITGNDTFRIRVRMFPEQNGGFVAGAYYVFQSATERSEEWHDVVTVRLDDPDPIPCDRVRFVTNNVGYLFLLQQFAVTTDAGGSWHLWNVNADWGNLPKMGAVIEKVAVHQDGTGTMQLRVFGRKPAFLSTADYGQHWTEQQ